MRHQEDPLSPLLREWQAPDPPPGMDAKMLAAFRRRTTRNSNWWAALWSARISIPVPVLAGLLIVLFAAANWLRRPAAPVPVPDSYVTRLEAVGFQPLRDGPVRVIRRTEEDQ